MVDPAALRQALAFYDENDKAFVMSHVGVYIAAAREFLRLMETGETVWWCEEHLSTGFSDEECTERVWRQITSPTCRMVSAVLTRREP